MKTDIESEVKNVLEIVEQVYLIKSVAAEKKLNNIKRINFDSLVNLIQKEISNDRIKSPKDMVNYIETIIED